MKIGLVQYSPEWENPEASIKRINKLIEAGISEPDVLVFPEMSLTGFTMASEKHAEEIDGTATLFFMQLARDLKKNVFAGIIERDRENIYNSLVHFDEKGIIISRYRKIHLFSLADEHKHYSAGDSSQVTKIGKTKIGLSVCYDLRFPEFYRAYGKERVHLIVNIASWPEKRIDHWKTLLKARAIENLCYVAGVNRVGTDKFQNYPGASCVFGPMGEEILMNENTEKILTAEVDFEKVDDIRSKFNFLEDIKLI